MNRPKNFEKKSIMGHIYGKERKIGLRSLSYILGCVDAYLKISCAKL